jgi:hypothetical protein
MKDVLLRGGFSIINILDTQGQFLDPTISRPSPELVRFEVAFPTGWAIVEGFDGYGLRDRALMQILDAAGHLRGEISLDWRNNFEPIQAVFYCRYVLNPFDGFYNRRLVESTPDSIVDVVIDRAGVDRKKPHDFPTVVYHNSRPAKKGPLVPPSGEDIKKYLNEEFARIDAGRPRLDLPVYRWLHDTYPNWQDPFCYW